MIISYPDTTNLALFVHPTTEVAIAMSYASKLAGGLPPKICTGIGIRDACRPASSKDQPGELSTKGLEAGRSGVSTRSAVVVLEFSDCEKVSMQVVRESYD